MQNDVNGENILPGFTLDISFIDDCISQVHYYFLFLCYNFHYLQINLSIDHRKDWKHQVKMIQLIVDCIQCELESSFLLLKFIKQTQGLINVTVF